MVRTMPGQSSVTGGIHRASCNGIAKDTALPVRTRVGRRACATGAILAPTPPDEEREWRRIGYDLPMTMRIVKLIGATAWLAVAASGATMLGCAGTKTPTSDTTRAELRMVRQTADGTYYVMCTSLTQPVPVNQIFALDVRVFRDAALKEAAVGVSVSADAAMPAHHHGMTLMPRATPIPGTPGGFRVNGMLLHMPGAWEIYIDVREKERSERARFEIEV